MTGSRAPGASTCPVALGERMLISSEEAWSKASSRIVTGAVPVASTCTTTRASCPLGTSPNDAPSASQPGPSKR